MPALIAGIQAAHDASGHVYVNLDSGIRAGTTTSGNSSLAAGVRGRHRSSNTLLGRRGIPGLSALLRRRAVLANFNFNDDMESVLKLMEKYVARIIDSAPEGLL
jgi:hypothetical protein